MLLINNGIVVIDQKVNRPSMKTRIALIFLAFFFITIMVVASYGYQESMSLLSSIIHHRYFTYSLSAIVLVTFFVAIIKGAHGQHSKIKTLQTANNTAETKLFEQQHLFETIFDHTSTGMALLNLDGQLMRVNDAFSELLGYCKEEMLALNIYHLFHGINQNEVQIHVQDLLSKNAKFYQSEHRCYHKNGETIYTLSTLSVIRDKKGSPLYFTLQVLDVTSQKLAEEKLLHLAYHDPLTGVANRNKFEQFMYHLLASVRRHQQDFALMYLDLDRFKHINDSVGHEAGDVVLKIIAGRIQNAVRNTDLVARLSGDEFVIVVTEVTQSESVAIIAQKLLRSIMEVVVVKNTEFYLSTSIGISVYPEDGDDLETLMKNTDLALYRAKEHGRNNYQFYTAEMTVRAQEKIALQNALAHGLVRQEFTLHYQPIMELSSRTINSLEALLRWKNPNYTLVSPNQIISLAEESGLIIPVSEWVMRTACRHLKTWHTMGYSTLMLSINCSARQFKQGTFVDDLLSCITAAAVPPSSIKIEVTEKTIMHDTENTLRVLYALKDMGIKIVIDDFGTGYWSLNNLKRLAVDEIKIDRSFIKSITTDPVSLNIVRATIAMTRQLGIRSIAVGVETKQQYDLLALEGCTDIQGYYLTQPLTEEATTTFLKHPIPDAEAIDRIHEIE